MRRTALRASIALLSAGYAGWLINILSGIDRKGLNKLEIADKLSSDVAKVTKTEVRVVDKGSNSAHIDTRLPISEPTKASNGLTIKSNTKHTPGAEGNRGNAGIEPRNSLDLFENSIPSPKLYPNKEVRYAKDSNGNIHRFDGTNGEFHWNGSTGDISNPLNINLIPNNIRNKLGVK